MNSVLQIIAKFFHTDDPLASVRNQDIQYAQYETLVKPWGAIVKKIANDTAPVTLEEAKAFRIQLEQIKDITGSKKFPRHVQGDAFELFRELLQSARDKDVRTLPYVEVGLIAKTGTHVYFKEGTISQLIRHDITRKKGERLASIEFKNDKYIKVEIDESSLLKILNEERESAIENVLDLGNDEREKILAKNDAQKTLKNKFEELLEKTYTNDDLKKIEGLLNKNGIRYTAPFAKTITKNGTFKNIFHIIPKEKGRPADHRIVEELTDKDLLPVRVDRFTQTHQRINTKILDPLNLTIPSSIQMAKGATDLKYTLEGFIAQTGTTIKSGHYTAYCKKNGQWRFYNDESVKVVKESEAEKAAEDGYVYIYRKYSPSN